jgi:uncharacterized protein with FMN-binding domain
MKKIIVTSFFILAFIGYSLYQNFGLSGKSIYVATNTSIPNSETSSLTPQPIIPAKKKKTAAPPSNTKTQTPSNPPTPIVKNGIYTDGTYTGGTADAYYGNIQVQAIIQNGQIADVQFLQYPNDRGTSIRINGAAMPILKSEAISAQNANVDIVSGATDSSQAFIQSLGSALAQAKNS